MSIEDLVEFKLEQWKLITAKLDTLDHYTIYLHPGLSYEDQIKFAKVGVFELGQDVKNYKAKYLEYDD